MEFWNKRQRFSIRKLNTGIASVLIGIALVGVLGTNTVKAETPATGTEEIYSELSLTLSHLVEVRCCPILDDAVNPATPEIQ